MQRGGRGGLGRTTPSGTSRSYRDCSFPAGTEAPVSDVTRWTPSPMSKVRSDGGVLSPVLFVL